MRHLVLAEEFRALPAGAYQHQRQIQAENEESPLDLAALFAERDRLPPGPARWIARMAELMDLPERPPQPFRRRLLGDNALLFEGVGDAPRRLLVVTTGNAMRPMMPVAAFLQRLPAEACDALFLRDPARLRYIGGVAGYGEGFAALAPRILADLPDARRGGIRTLGTSSGGAAALHLGLLLGADQAVCVGGSHPLLDPARAEKHGFDGQELGRALDATGARGAPTRLFCVHGAAHPRDAAGAASLQAALPGVRILSMPGLDKHNLLFALRQRGALDAFLHRVAFGTLDDGVPWWRPLGKRPAEQATLG